MGQRDSWPPLCPFDPWFGCHVYQCPNCHKIEIVPHSCKSRFCPSCGKLATDRWADEVLNELLDVPYHHLVMSAPWQLGPIIAFNREVGLNLLAQQEGAKDPRGREAKGMLWHPHVHLLVTEGGLSQDGAHWIRPYKQGWLMLESGIKKMWRYHCITAFRQAHRSGQLRWQAQSAFLKNYPCFNKLLSQLYELKWYVHIGAALLDPAATVRYIGRYTKRAVLAEYRITYYDGKVVRLAYRDYAQDGKTSYKTLPVLAFIGRLIRHIPDKNFKMVRHAGLFAPRWKARYLAQARAALHQPIPLAQQAEQASLLPWRQRQAAEQGADPLICSTCLVQMELVQVLFGSHAAIAKYFDIVQHPKAPFHPAWQPAPG